MSSENPGRGLHCLRRRPQVHEIDDSTWPPVHCEQSANFRQRSLRRIARGSQTNASDRLRAATSRRQIAETSREIKDDAFDAFSELFIRHVARLRRCRDARDKSEGIRRDPKGRAESA